MNSSKILGIAALLLPFFVIMIVPKPDLIEANLAIVTILALAAVGGGYPLLALGEYAGIELKYHERSIQHLSARNSS